MAIGFSGLASKKPFQALVVDGVPSFDLLEKTQFVPRYRYLGEERIDNITDWALGHFRTHYKAEGLSKDSIFNYVYAVLNDPAYREKYATDLRRDFPRIPLYGNFERWAAWGKELIDLHLHFENLSSWPLGRVDTKDHTARTAGISPKAVLKADKDNGIIRLNGETQLVGVPPQAWAYRLGNRSAVECVLDQYSEREPADPTILKRFDAYRFADYKEAVIDLIGKVVRVSVETQRIIEQMNKSKLH
jgi:predicted helicase